MTPDGYYSVRNWDELQHYKHRDPPWVKLYRKLLGNYAWCGLPDAAKGHLVGLWLLAGRNDNKIPADLDWIAQQIGAREPVDMQVLMDAGFVEVSSNVLATCPVLPMLETERETEIETETEKEKAVVADAPRFVENPMGLIIPAIRKYLYVPDGKPPADWDERRDASIAKVMLGKGDTASDILAAIEGIRLVADAGWLQDWTPTVRPGDKLTLRVLYHTKSGALPTVTMALNALGAARNAERRGKATPRPLAESVASAAILRRQAGI